MKTLGRVVLGLVAGYIAGALIGWAGLELFSTNTHDRSVEAAMTAAFVAGPTGALLGLITALFWKR